MFVDKIRATLVSGNGGPGSVSFRREKYVPKGGPDGGNGGKGGDVIVVCKENLKTLSHLRNNKVYRAQSGGHGMGQQKSGAKGSHFYLEVPPGTAIKDLETGEVLCQLNSPKDQVVLLQGGRGGQGNMHFATGRRRTPRFAQDGTPGSSLEVIIELELIADVALVGYPNAGKSSLIKSMTAAKPQVGDYPFTTKIPNLGVMKWEDQEVVVADIPGLLEGASEGYGLGHRFLKHISKTRALCYCIDGNDEPDFDHVLSVLRSELENYDRSLLDVPAMVLITKVDIPNAHRRALDYAKKKNLHVGRELFPVSAITHQGMEELQKELVIMVAASRSQQHMDEEAKTKPQDGPDIGW